MRQHVNPLSNTFRDLKPIPPLNEIFTHAQNPLHLDIGCGSGNFLKELAMQNKNWNYLGLEIREKLVLQAKSKFNKEHIDNLFFVFGNADILIKDSIDNFPKDVLFSVSFNFPDPWFKKRHHKRRVIQPEIIFIISKLMASGGLISIKSDVYELFKYMDLIILQSNKYIKFSFQNHELNCFYNPNKLKTNREKYALEQRLTVYEKLYKKI